MPRRVETCRGWHIQQSGSEYVSDVSQHVVVLWSANSDREGADNSDIRLKLAGSAPDQGEGIVQGVQELEASIRGRAKLKNIEK